MSNIELTNQQKRYLLLYLDEPTARTISSFADRFECSRANSKKILDRMVKMGLFYKVQNDYCLTDFGQRISSELARQRNDVALVLFYLFGQTKVRGRQCANEIMRLANDELKQLFLNKSTMLSRLPQAGQMLSHKELAEILGRGKYEVLFHIYKHSNSDGEIVLKSSMANNAYQNRATLDIGDESFLVVYPQSIKRAHGGYFKKGVARELGYQIDGSMHWLKIIDGAFQIPLHVLHTWQYLGSTIFCTNIQLMNRASIGFVNHTNKAYFMFVLNIMDS